MRLTPSGVGEAAAFALYAALWTILAPFLAVYLALRSRYRPLLGRFRAAPPPVPRGALWIHACSVGEVNAARPLLDALTRSRPGQPVFVTASTRSGHAHAVETLPGVATLFCPFDHPVLVGRFLKAAQPAALVLVETELWPATLRAARRSGIPVVLVNGRISDRHFNRYRRVPWLVRPMMRALHGAAMQSRQYAERIEAMGLDAGRVRVCGSIKFDGAWRQPPHDVTERLDAAVQPDPTAPLLALGSSRPGDEARMVVAWQAARVRNPGAQLAIALRHPERIEEAEQACKGYPTRRRSACSPGDPWRGDSILLLDTFGELPALYARATLVVIGGSFDRSIQGHNPIEPAALGKPVVFGPFMRNFDEAAALLLEAKAAIQVGNGTELAAAINELLLDPGLREKMAAAGTAVVAAQQGAAERMASIVFEALENASGGR